MLEFFGLTKLSNGKFGFMRKPDGAWSWQHIVIVSVFMVAMFALGIWLGLRDKQKDEKSALADIFYQPHESLFHIFRLISLLRIGERIVNGRMVRKMGVGIAKSVPSRALLDDPRRILASEVGVRLLQGIPAVVNKM